MKILAIESSCDETAAAIVENGTTILGTAVASSAVMHAKYGGIVPEIAAREQVECIIPVIEDVLHQTALSIDSIDSLAVTVGPGLIGSLLVGVETAKTIAFVKKKPIIPVNHVLAHMYANFLDTSQEQLLRKNSRGNISFPAISLVVSGGHTELFIMTSKKDVRWLGGTLDDAAGECFDKTARLLGFENRGGVAIQEAALNYHPTASSPSFRLPRPMLDTKNALNFSFSGLKTAISREVHALKEKCKLDNETISFLSHEVQETISDVLIKKSLFAAEKFSVKSILLSGGVSANLRLREKFMATLNTKFPSVQLHIPPVSLCTDNAAYIAAYAYFRGKSVDWHEITAAPDLSVENF